MSLDRTPGGEQFKRSTPQKPVYVQVVDQIRQLIKEGKLSPGDQLLSERELAENLGLSRTSVRQALAVLEGMGIIEITPRDGAYVRQRTLEGAVEPLTQVLYQEREQVAHLFEVRRIIETQAACLAAERCTAADAQHLRALNRKFEQGLHNRDLAYDANIRFHLGIVETAKNPILTEILGSLLTATVEVYATAREQSLSSTSNLARFVLEHEEIVDAIARKEAESSADLLAAHIDGAQRRVEQVMRAR